MTGLRNAQIAGKILFLAVSVRVFLEKISILIGRLSKDQPSPMWVGMTQSTEGLNGTKRQRKCKFAVYV